MKGFFRGLAILLGLGVVMVIAISVGGYLWFTHNAPDLQRQRQAAISAGAQAAVAGDGEHCVAAALDRLAGCQGLVCEEMSRLYLHACLDAAAPAASFCQGVPDPQRVIESSRWTADRCEAAGHHDDAACARVMGGMQEHCHAPGALLQSERQRQPKSAPVQPARQATPPGRPKPSAGAAAAPQ